MLKAAYANTPYRTPASIRGPSLKELYVQQKANDEMEDILSSNSYTAGAAAFSKGIAAGAALPLILGGFVPWSYSAGAIQNKVEAQAHLAALLKKKTKDLSTVLAAEQAASIYHFLSAQQKLPDVDLIKKLQPDMSTWNLHEPIPTTPGKMSTRVAAGPFSTRRAAEDAFRGSAAEAGLSPEGVKSGLKKLIKEIPGPGLPKGQLNPTQVAAVLDSAARAFAEGKGSLVAPLVKAHGKHLATSLGKALPAAALLAIPAGLAGYLRHRRKYKMLQSLREQRARRSRHA